MLLSLGSQSSPGLAGGPLLSAAGGPERKGGSIGMLLVKLSAALLVGCGVSSSYKAAFGLLKRGISGP